MLVSWLMIEATTTMTEKNQIGYMIFVWIERVKHWPNIGMNEWSVSESVNWISNLVILTHRSISMLDNSAGDCRRRRPPPPPFLSKRTLSMAERFHVTQTAIKHQMIFAMLFYFDLFFDLFLFPIYTELGYIDAQRKQKQNQLNVRLSTDFIAKWGKKLYGYGTP